MNDHHHVIWSNRDLDYDDWKDDLEAEYPDLSDNERYALMYEINNGYLEDERVNQKITYMNLMTSGKLNQHLQEIEQTARTRIEQMVSEMAQANGVNEELKATDPMKWVGLMNNFKISAEEQILAELIYA